MTKKQAIEFLTAHQPMPPDAEISSDTIDAYDAARKYFLVHPDKVCIPLFLKSFGEGDGLGVYPLIETLLLKFPRREVVPHLLHSLSSPFRSVRYWSSDLAASFPSEQLVVSLTRPLRDNDSDIKCASITALESIGTPEALSSLKVARGRETDRETLQLLNEVLERFDA